MMFHPGYLSVCVGSSVTCVENVRVLFLFFVLFLFREFLSFNVSKLVSEMHVFRVSVCAGH